MEKLLSFAYAEKFLKVLVTSTLKHSSYYNDNGATENH